jgi:hypothetical protein
LSKSTRNSTLNTDIKIRTMRPNILNAILHTPCHPARLLASPDTFLAFALRKSKEMCQGNTRHYPPDNPPVKPAAVLFPKRLFVPA